MQITDSTVALITGAASGLGEQTARRLLDAGARVLLVDLPGGRGQELADELGERVAFADYVDTHWAPLKAALYATDEQTNGQNGTAKPPVQRPSVAVDRRHEQHGGVRQDVEGAVVVAEGQLPREDEARLP